MMDLNQAFELAQRHNAFILRQQINERILLERYEVDQALRDEYLDLKLQSIENSFSVEHQYTKEGFDRLSRIESRRDSLLQIINTKYPQVAEAKNDFSVASIHEIQDKLQDDQAVIKYFEGEENLYSFVITKENAHYFVHDNRPQISAMIDQLRGILSEFSYKQLKMDSLESEFLSLAHELGKSIISDEIKNLPEGVKKITIIPAGSLTKIPFETLILKEKESWSAPNDYLISDYAISYNYFCKELTSETMGNKLEKVLSYGLEYDDYTLNASKKLSNDSISKQIIEKFRSEALGHLYFADEEAMEIADMLNGTSFTNENATKRNFLVNFSDYDVVHVSAHAYVDFQYPGNSAIIFSKKDSTTDNLLRVRDVDRLKLDGQLFTLSACNTFYGKNNEGEGLSSIARSFIQAGAGSVVGSFWSVPDEISKIFMIEFYSKMKKDKSCFNRIENRLVMPFTF